MLSPKKYIYGTAFALGIALVSTSFAFAAHNSHRGPLTGVTINTIKSKLASVSGRNISTSTSLFNGHAETRSQSHSIFTIKKSHMLVLGKQNRHSH